jgi:hypothetical protein
VSLEANQLSSRSHHAGIRVYDEIGNVIETHEHVGTSFTPTSARLNAADGLLHLAESR